MNNWPNAKIPFEHRCLLRGFLEPSGFRCVSETPQTMRFELVDEESDTKFVAGFDGKHSLPTCVFLWFVGDMQIKEGDGMGRDVMEALRISLRVPSMGRYAWSEQIDDRVCNFYTGEC